MYMVCLRSCNICTISFTVFNLLFLFRISVLDYFKYNGLQVSNKHLNYTFSLSSAVIGLLTFVFHVITLSSAVISSLTAVEVEGLTVDSACRTKALFFCPNLGL